MANKVIITDGEGISGQVLTSNGSGSAPSFKNVTGSGDMLKSTYDTNDNGKVDTSDVADNLGSPTVIGGEISKGTNTGTFKVASLTGFLRSTNNADGKLVAISKTEEDNIEITTADTIYFVSLNYNNGSPTISLETSNPYELDKRNIPIGKVMKDSSNNVHYVSGGYDFQDGFEKLNERAKTLRAFELNGGSAISYSGTNNFKIEEGIVFGGINKFTLPSFDSSVTQFIPVYSDGAGGWTYGAKRNTIDYEHYDNGDGTLGNVGNAKYGCFWVYRHVDDGDVYVRYGVDSYSLAAAETAKEPTKPSHLTAFGLLIGKIIVPQSGGSFADIQMVNETFFTGTETSNHANLTNLDYASSGHTGFAPALGEDDNYVTDAEKAILSNTSGTNTGDETTTTLGAKINSATEKTTPVNADMVGLMDSEASNILKKLSWSNIKATLKTYFDTLYQEIGSYITASSTDTLTNKRITPRVGTTTSASTITPNSDNYDIYTITALAVNATIAAPSGTPTNGQSLLIRIKDNGTSRTLTWNSIYNVIGVELPTATTAGKTHYIGCKYNSANSKWDVLAIGCES